MGASTIALTAFEVTVGCGGATLAGFQLVGVHGQTHGATGFAPFKTSGFENLVQALLLGLGFDQTRARNHHGKLDVLGHFLTQLFHHGGGFAHVFNSAVGARTDKHFVDKQVVQGLARLQAHVGKGTLNRVAFVGVFFFIGVWYAV